MLKRSLRDTVSCVCVSYLVNSHSAAISCRLPSLPCRWMCNGRRTANNWILVFNGIFVLVNPSRSSCRAQTHTHAPRHSRLCAYLIHLWSCVCTWFTELVENAISIWFDSSTHTHTHTTSEWKRKVEQGKEMKRLSEPKMKSTSIFCRFNLFKRAKW